jgi:hypothetical protein
MVATADATEMRRIRTTPSISEKIIGCPFAAVFFISYLLYVVGITIAIQGQ